MPQTFQVLRCYKCLVFQVHPTKKSNKWKCKMCGETQSMKRFYGIGTGKECRSHVQRLNGIRGDLDNSKCEGSDPEVSLNSDTSEKTNEVEPVYHVPVKKSKWQDYIDIENEDNKLQDPSPDESEITLEKLKKAPKKIINDGNKTSVLSKKGAALKTNYTNDCVIKPFQKNRPTESGYNHTILKDANKCVSNQRVQNSKWAQFIEENKNCSGDSSSTCCNNTQEKSKIIFSSLDDDDLDAVLEL